MTGARPVHTLRKEFGSQVCNKYGIYAASRALRHADISITGQHYLDKRQPTPAGLGKFLSRPLNVTPLALTQKEVPLLGPAKRPKGSRPVHSQ